MTDVNGIYWQRRGGDYIQPQVCEPPINQNANNARHAVWHLSRLIEVEIYPTRPIHGWRAANTDPVDDGRADRGEPIVFKLWGVIQPYRSGDRHSSELVRDAWGEHTEGDVVVHVDSHQQENLDIIAADPALVALFPNGLRILGPDTEGPVDDDRRNFSTVFRFRNRRWRVCNVAELFEAGDENLHDEGAVYRAVCKEFQDRNHERDAKSGDHAPFFGPDGPIFVPKVEPDC